GSKSFLEQEQAALRDHVLRHDCGNDHRDRLVEAKNAHPCNRRIGILTATHAGSCVAAKQGDRGIDHDLDRAEVDPEPDHREHDEKPEFGLEHVRYAGHHTVNDGAVAGTAGKRTPAADQGYSSPRHYTFIPPARMRRLSSEEMTRTI